MLPAAPQNDLDGSVHGKIKKGWSDGDASLLITLVHKHREHKNKWKLVAAEMPDARTPGQVKEKYHRMQKLPEFEHLSAKLLDMTPNPQTVHCEPPKMSAPETSLFRLMTSQKSASGFRGVSRAGSRWEAYIGNGTAGKRYIGRFDTPREAAIAYAQAYSSQPKASPNLDSRNHAPSIAPEPQRVCGPCKHRRKHCREEVQDEAQGESAGSSMEAGCSQELVRSSKAASGYMGVAKAGCRWEAYISAGERGKRFKRYIGCYDTPELAAQAYLDATTKSERDDDESDEDEASQDWFSDEYEEARNQVIHTLSSLPSLACVAHDTPPCLVLPPVHGSATAEASAELLLQVMKCM